MAMFCKFCVLLVFAISATAGDAPFPNPCKHVLRHNELDRTADHFPVDDQFRLCCLCGPGEFLKELCRADDRTTTQCQPCVFDELNPNNQSFMDEYGHSHRTCKKAQPSCSNGLFRVRGNLTNPPRCVTEEISDFPEVSTMSPALTPGHIVAIVICSLVFVGLVVGFTLCYRAMYPPFYKNTPTTDGSPIDNVETGLSSDPERGESKRKLLGCFPTSSKSELSVNYNNSTSMFQRSNQHSETTRLKAVKEYFRNETYSQTCGLQLKDGRLFAVKFGLQLNLKQQPPTEEETLYFYVRWAIKHTEIKSTDIFEYFDKETNLKTIADGLKNAINSV